MKKKVLINPDESLRQMTEVSTSQSQTNPGTTVLGARSEQWRRSELSSALFVAREERLEQRDEGHVTRDEEVT